jgi:hypothetical protein
MSYLRSNHTVKYYFFLGQRNRRVSDLFAKLVFDVPRFYRNKRYAYAIRPGRDRRFNGDQRRSVTRCLAAKGYRLEGHLLHVRSSEVTVLSETDPHMSTGEEKALHLAIKAGEAWLSERASTGSCVGDILEESKAFVDLFRRVMQV